MYISSAFFILFWSEYKRFKLLIVSSVNVCSAFQIFFFLLMFTCTFFWFFSFCFDLSTKDLNCWLCQTSMCVLRFKFFSFLSMLVCTSFWLFSFCFDFCIKVSDRWLCQALMCVSRFRFFFFCKCSHVHLFRFVNYVLFKIKNFKIYFFFFLIFFCVFLFFFFCQCSHVHFFVFFHSVLFSIHSF